MTALQQLEVLAEWQHLNCRRIRNLQDSPTPQLQLFPSPFVDEGEEKEERKKKKNNKQDERTNEIDGVSTLHWISNGFNFFILLFDYSQHRAPKKMERQGS
ncbi:hypothetical protein EYR41_006491 [Orbilia oligospora]|uniref:Uncharacterized protein n=1 Tax=Orbilia oligospora TaxID=2813651 RepID=A0A7C8TRV0_ORBOL|nr:hypothetical protein TWF751_001943 [Orbilia oligospora]TGJ67358.1 hypothetical protein EYR41_006491 [Orbilia oligospora]